MTNDKKNMNELVTDDEDPTAELEALSLQDVEELSESSAHTHDFFDKDNGARASSISELKSDLKNRSETIGRLQFDIEQLRSKWIGLETEIKAREDIGEGLIRDLDDTRATVERKEKLLKKRDRSIKALKAEIRERGDDFGDLKAGVMQRDQRIDELQEALAADRNDEVAAATERLRLQAGQIASADTQINELQAQIERTEHYADSLRRKLQERTSDTDAAEDTREFLELSLERANHQLEETQSSLAEEKSHSEQLREELDGIKEAHTEEIRIIRFELGEAQDTLAQNELVAEQLASDLVDTRSFKDELEQMINTSEEESRSQIEKLDKQNRKLLREAAANEDKLETKSDAINCLLAELSKKTQQIDSIGEIEEVIHEIDDRMSERIDERASGKDRDRVTRLLIGSVEGQELRFPLFKNRLTIGRTEQNDIQLKASYVSRRHAVVVTERDATRVIDWGSKNGVFVNSARISEHFLKSGDTLTIGTADFIYEERPKRDS